MSQAAAPVLQASLDQTVLKAVQVEHGDSTVPTNAIVRIWETVIIVLVNACVFLVGMARTVLYPVLKDIMA